MGDRVGNRVNLFTITANENFPTPSKASAHPNEDDYICETCATPRVMTAFSRSAMSVEGILLKILTEVAELAKQGTNLSTSEPITEESPSRTSPPALMEHESDARAAARDATCIDQELLTTEQVYNPQNYRIYEGSRGDSETPGMDVYKYILDNQLLSPATNHYGSDHWLLRLDGAPTHQNEKSP
ncbi:hypothetical protein ANCDUO_15729 [Ancylostoma duodenale]|uniref:Uncharacterized protein n=1 Tax=Ancylostoma duodenale TaxID=51022 RepID=A0A0C2GB43_9BILA|nr:hypothetical protein ANCDUO_15729 [Ancylostoma duodenale]